MRAKLLHEIFRYIRENYKETHQIFDSRNIVGDVLFPVQSWGDVKLEYCPSYDYFEIFGLNEQEFAFLEKRLENAENDI